MGKVIFNFQFKITNRMYTIYTSINALYKWSTCRVDRDIPLSAQLRP